MQKFFLILLILVSLQLRSQDSLKNTIDTTVNSDVTSGYDSLNKIREDSIFKEMLEQNNRNLNDFLRYQKELESRQKRNAFIRIGLGILFFGVLVFGLYRQRKKRQ